MDALNITADSHRTITTTTYSNETEAVTNSIIADKTLSEDTTWAELGLSGELALEFASASAPSPEVIQFDSTMSIADTAELLNDYGITLTIQDGKAVWDYDNSDPNAWILTNELSYSEIMDALNINSASHATIVTSTTWSNTTSDSLTANVEATINTNSTFADIGLTSQQELEIVSDGLTKTITVESSTTLSDFMKTLTDEGFACDITNGKITITGKDGIYIKSANATLFNLLNITNDTTYDSEIKTGYSNSSSDQLFVGAEGTLSVTTTFSQLEVTTDNNLIEIQKGEETHTITVKSTDTVGNLVSQINDIMGAGTAEIRDGMFYINSNENAYLKTIDPDIANALNLSTNISDYTSTTESTSESTIVSDRLNITTPSSTSIASTSTKLSEIIGAESLSDYILDLGEAGTYTFDANTTIQDVIDRLDEDGITATLGADGKITIKANGNMTVGGDLGSLFAGANPNITLTETPEEVSYTGSKITFESTTSEPVTYDTKLSDLGGLNITPGAFNLVIDNVTHKIDTTSESTLGSLKEALEIYDGVEVELVNTADGLVFEVNYNGDIRFENSADANASNIVEKLFNNGFQQANRVTSQDLKENKVSLVEYTATEESLLSDYDNGENKCAGELTVNVNGEAKTITITSEETFGTFIDKLADIGVNATLQNGTLKIDSLGDTVTFDAGASSKIVQNLNLVSTDDLGLMISDTSLEEKTSRVENINGSVAGFAGFETQLSMLGITSGAFTIYRDGQKAQINVDSNGTFEDLQNEIHKQFTDVNLKFEKGYLEIYSTSDDIDILCSASNDTSNIASILGLNISGNSIRSSRELYMVKGESKLTTDGLFKKGQVTEGTFVVGNATFTIDENTTLNDIISQINSSSETNATAYWDSVAGNFVIKSRSSGASLINIEAGTSNFTDIVGFTSSEWNPDGTLANTKLLAERQELGGNAEFTIDGTKYTSTSNTVGSDITKIKGVTLDLKAASNGETVTVTVGKDYNSAADAMQEVVEAYNTLIENVDKELAADGKLNDESTLKFLRNQIRNLMMGSISGGSAFTNLASIGISTEGASANNISVSNINKLEFNKEKFIDAFKKDSQAVEHLLVGNGIQQGILTKVENVVENSVKAVTGYFSSAENSYTKQISRLDAKIEKANAAVATYKSRLEQKFQYMDMMISKMQEQFSTFLGT